MHRRITGRPVNSVGWSALHGVAYQGLRVVSIRRACVHAVRRGVHQLVCVAAVHATGEPAGAGGADATASAVPGEPPGTSAGAVSMVQVSPARPVPGVGASGAARHPPYTSYLPYHP